MQGLDLRHLRAAPPGRLGARHRNVDAFQVRRQPGRPGIRPGRVWRRRDGVTGGPHPSGPHEVAHHPRGRTVHHHHHLMARRMVISTRHQAARFAVKMGRRVPAVGAEVQAAADGHLVVDDKDLLMVARAVGDA